MYWKHSVFTCIVYQTQDDEHTGSEAEGDDYEDDADDEYIDTDHDLDEDQVNYLIQGRNL
jgi:hypothetical protein